MTLGKTKTPLIKLNVILRTTVTLVCEGVGAKY